MVLKHLILVSVILSTINAYRILAVISTPSYSHQAYYRPIWMELLKRGHQITLVTTDPINDPKLVNLTEIDVHESYELLNELYLSIPKLSHLEVMGVILKSVDNILDYQLSHDSVKKLIRNESLFDVVITESITYELLAFADLYKCPKILVSSFELSYIVHGILGNPINPVTNPDVILPYVSGAMNFKERLFSFLYQPLYYLYKIISRNPKRYEIFKKHFGDQVRSPNEIVSDVDLVLANDNPMISDVRATGPNLIHLDAGLHMQPPKPLPKDLQDYLDSASEGCIFFSLGTNSKSMFMSREKIQIILEALSELPYKVLWKFELENEISSPENVKFVAWVPQQDVLRHPNVKLFITQGGIHSLEESILSRVPMAMMPMFGDQEANAERMKLRGLTRVIPHKPLPDKEEFKSIVLDVIANPKYKQNIDRTAELMMDQPMRSLDKAVWWIEYVVRHRGAKHLRNPSADVPLYQYYCLDLMAAITLLFYTVFKVISSIAKKLKSLICGTGSRNAKKGSGKKEKKIKKS